MTRIGLLGSTGRTGSWVAKLLETEYAGKAELASAVHRGGDLRKLHDLDAVIDFSSPEAMLQLARELQTSAAASLPALVVGSTGWTIDSKRELERLAERTPILVASNFSTGVLALIHVLRQAAPMLEKLGYTPVIVDTHHQHKKDSPSGTALSLQRAISPSGPGNVQTVSVRAGEIIGDHEVTFYGPGDHLTFGHFAQDRSIFARGSIEAAIWLASRRQGSSPLRGIVTMETFFKERYL